MNRLEVGASGVSLGQPSTQPFPQTTQAGQTSRRGSRSCCLRPASRRSRVTGAGRARSTCRRFPHRCPRSPSIPADSWQPRTAATDFHGLPTKSGLLDSDHASVGLPSRTCRANSYLHHSRSRSAHARNRHFGGRGSCGADTTTLRTGGSPRARLVLRRNRPGAHSPPVRPPRRTRSRHCWRNSSTTTTTQPTRSI
jgi:hypothetical protein